MQIRPSCPLCNTEEYKGKEQGCKKVRKTMRLLTQQTSLNEAEETNQIFMFSSETVFVESPGEGTDLQSGKQAFL